MTEKFPIAADQLRTMAATSAAELADWIERVGLSCLNFEYGVSKEERIKRHAMIVAALRAQSDVRAPAPQGEPVAFVPVHPRNGPLWSDTFPAGSELARSENYPRTALYAAPPADLAEVLENVRKGIESLGRKRHTGVEVPIELHKACQALTHMVKDSRSVSDLRERAASILNGATGGQDSWSKWDREVFDVVDEAADEIANLRAQLEGCKEMFAHTAERANEYVEAFQQQEGKLASARKALEFIRDGYDRNDINHVDFRVGAYKAALSALSDEEGKS
jgi:hypothetical protein